MKTLAQNILKILIVLGILFTLVLPTIGNVVNAENTTENNSQMSLSNLILNNVERIENVSLIVSKLNIFDTVTRTVGDDDDDDEDDNSGEESEEVDLDDYSVTFSYNNGEPEEYTIEKSGIYRLTCEGGATGLSEKNKDGEWEDVIDGCGGFAGRYVYLRAGDVLYIVVGDKGGPVYNDKGKLDGYKGGGASFITNAKMGDGKLSDYTNKENILIVAGGAGGNSIKNHNGSKKTIAGDGGGLTGNSGTYLNKNSRWNTTAFNHGGRQYISDEVQGEEAFVRLSHKKSGATIHIWSGLDGKSQQVLFKNNKKVLSRRPVFIGGEGWMNGDTVGTKNSKHVKFLAGSGGSSFVGWPNYTGTAYSEEDWKNVSGFQTEVETGREVETQFYYVKYEDGKIVYDSEEDPEENIYTGYFDDTFGYTRYKNEVTKGWNRVGRGTADVELVAELPATFNITYETNDGTINDTNVAYQYTEGVGVDLPSNVTKEHCVFEGWFNNKDCTVGTGNGPFNSVGVGASGDKTYYAKWKPAIAYIDRSTGRQYYYVSLQEAFDDANNGETIVLVKDVVEDVVNNKDVTLNIGYHNITGKVNGGIALENKNKLKIVGTGGKISTAKSGTAAIADKTGKELTLEGVNVYSENATAVLLQRTIKPGYYEPTEPGYVADHALNITGGSLTTATGKALKIVKGFANVTNTSINVLSSSTGAGIDNFGGKLNVTGANISTVDTIAVINAGICELKDCSITTSEIGKGQHVFGIVSNSDKGLLTLSGTTTIATVNEDKEAETIAVRNSTYGIVYIKDQVSISNFYCGVYNESGQLVVSGGTIDSYSKDEVSIANFGKATIGENAVVKTAKGRAIVNAGTLRVTGGAKVEQYAHQSVTYTNERMVAIYNTGSLEIDGDNGAQIAACLDLGGQNYNEGNYYDTNSNIPLCIAIENAKENERTLDKDGNSIEENGKASKIKIKNNSNIEGKVLGINVELTFDPNGGSNPVFDNADNGNYGNVLRREYNSTLLKDSYTDIRNKIGDKIYPETVKEASSLQRWVSGTKTLENNVKINKTETYTAVWDWAPESDFPVAIFHTNGGIVEGYNKNSMGDYYVYYNPENGLTLPEAIKEDTEGTGKFYVFLGWYENANFDGPVQTAIPAGTNENKEYWAKYEEANRIELHTYGGKIYDGENEIESISSTSGRKVKVTQDSDGKIYRILYIKADEFNLPTNVKRNNDLFKGWVDEEGNLVTKIEQNKQKNMVLKALYKVENGPGVYEVKLNAKEDLVLDGNINDYEYKIDTVNTYKDIVTDLGNSQYVMYYRHNEGCALPVATKTKKNDANYKEVCKVWYDMNGKGYSEIDSNSRENLSLYAVYGTPFKLYEFIQDIDVNTGDSIYKHQEPDSPYQAKVIGLNGRTTIRRDEVKDVFKEKYYQLNTTKTAESITVSENEIGIFRLYYDISTPRGFKIKRINTLNNQLIDSYPIIVTQEECEKAQIFVGEDHKVTLAVAIGIANGREGILPEYNCVNSEQDKWSIDAFGRTEIVLKYTPKPQVQYEVWNWYEKDNIAVGTELVANETYFEHDEMRNDSKMATEGIEHIDLSKIEEQKYKKTGFEYFDQIIITDNTTKRINIYWARSLYDLVLIADDGRMLVTEQGSTTPEERTMYSTKYKYSDYNQKISRYTSNVTMKEQTNYIFDGWETNINGREFFNIIPGGMHSTLTYYDVWYEKGKEYSVYKIQYQLQKFNNENGVDVLDELSNNRYFNYGEPVDSKHIEVGKPIENISCPIWATINEEESQLNGEVVTGNKVLLSGTTTPVETIIVKIDRNKYEVQFKNVENATINNYGSVMFEDSKYKYFFKLSNETNTILPPEKINNIENIVRQGYNFAGWHTDRACSSERIFVIPTGTWNDIEQENILTYWADWNRINELEYYVDIYAEIPNQNMSSEFDLSDENNYTYIRTIQGPTKLAFGESVLLTDEFINGLKTTGYDWDKENKLNNLRGSADENGNFYSKGVTNNHLKVYFQRHKYNLVLNGNGGTVNTQTEAKYEFKFSENAIDFPTVTTSREGYTHLAITDKNGNNHKVWVDSEDPKGIKTNYTQIPENTWNDKTYYAVWVENQTDYAQYNVNFMKRKTDNTSEWVVYNDEELEKTHIDAKGTEITVDRIQIPNGFVVNNEESGLHGLGGTLIDNNKVQVDDNQFVSEITIYLDRKEYIATLNTNEGIIDTEKYTNVKESETEEYIYYMTYLFRNNLDKDIIPNKLPEATRLDSEIFNGWYNNILLMGSEIDAITDFSKENQVFYAGWVLQGYGAYEIHFNIQNENLSGYRELTERTFNSQATTGTNILYDNGKVLLNNMPLKYEDGQDIVFFDDIGFVENISNNNRKADAKIGSEKVILNIYFDREQYHVNLHPNGGKINGCSGIYGTIYHYGANDRKLPVPELPTGYAAFCGWQYNDNLEPITEIGKGEYGDKEYTASYSVDPIPTLNSEYTVEYYLENYEGEYELYTSKLYVAELGATVTIDGTNKFNIYEKLEDGTIVALKDARYSVHNSFVENANLGFKSGKTTSAKRGEDGHLILRLYFDRATYNITYYTDGGTINGDKATNYKYSGLVLRSEENMLNVLGPVYLPTEKNVKKVGYRPDVWYALNDPKFETKISHIKVGESSDKYYVANWKIDGQAEYVIMTYYQDGPSSNMYSTEYAWGPYLGTIGENTPEIKNSDDYMIFCAYEGYIPNVSHPNTITQTEITEDGKAMLKLYYNYDSGRESYDIILKTDGGIITNYQDLEEIPVQASTYKTTKIKDMVKVLPSKENVYKENFTFKGWYYKDENNSDVGPVVVIDDLDNRDRELFAKYDEGIIENPASYTIRTYYEVGNNPKKIIVDYTDMGKVNSPVEITNPQKYCALSGYLIDEVKSKPTMRGTIKSDGSLVLELYFKYIERTQYKVTLEPRGGKVKDSEWVERYYYGIPQELPMNVTRGTYEFQGWYKDLAWTDGRHYIIKAGETGDQTYYAKWLTDFSFEGLRVATKSYVIGTTINPEGYHFGDTTEYKEGDKYISRVAPRNEQAGKIYQQGTTALTFKSGLIIMDKYGFIVPGGYDIQILDQNGNVIEDNDLVGTGMKVVVTGGKENKERVELTIVVIGDLDGNGKIDQTDVTEATAYMSLGKFSETNLSEDQKTLKNMASDINFNGIAASHSEQDDVTAFSLSTTGKQIFENRKI